MFGMFKHRLPARPIPRKRVGMTNDDIVEWVLSIKSHDEVPSDHKWRMMRMLQILIRQAGLGRRYVVSDKMPRSLLVKLTENSAPGSVIQVNDEEMKYLRKYPLYEIKE